MTPKDFNRYIKIIEDKLDIKLSDEQLSILKYDYKSPVLLNSCAGAGKTTLLMISIILQILDHRKPNKILAITFSKAAQKDMVKKFDNELHDLGITNLTDKPTFKTFDALFYNLLRTIKPHLRVLAPGSKEWANMQWDLKKRIKIKPKIISESDLVDNIMNFREQLINNQYSMDGLKLKEGPTTSGTLKDAGDKMNVPYDKVFYKNYLSVMHTYEKKKKQLKQVDFTDMKTELYKVLGNSKQAKTIKDIMNQYEICFIDEFQDINSLQWTLLDKLLSKSAKAHLAAIGDDDQSIYAFRGSNPKFIMNFAKDNQNARIFNLSTNYRTAGNVLEAVKPVIKSNQYRLDKDLLTSDEKLNQGKIIAFNGTVEHSGSSIMLESLLNQLTENEFDNDSITVLCRNNVDISIASDYLANHGQYVNLHRSSNIMQNNPMYKSLLGIGRAITLDEFMPFYNNSNKIGFSKYKTHIENVLRENHLKSLTSLYQYLVLAAKYDEQHLDDNNRNDHQIYQWDRLVNNAFQNIHQKDLGHKGLMLINVIIGLTGMYYQWMIDNHYEDSSLYHIIKDYIETNLEDIEDLDEFYKNEDNKRNMLTNIISSSEDGRVNFMTIHQSKGLEFDEVYLYNMRANGINSYDVWLNSHFAPNLTKHAFLDKYLAIDFTEIRLPEKMVYIADFQIVLNTAYRNCRSQSQKDHVTDALINNKTKTFSSDIIGRFNTLYHNIMSDSQLVEDERRLIYVALTRSIKNAYYNIDNHDEYTNTSPLLHEIKMNRDNVLSVNDKHQLIPSHQLFDDKDYSAEDENDFYNAFNQ